MPPAPPPHYYGRMDLKRCKVINLVHEDFEDLELWYPTLRLREEGITVHLVGESKE